MSKLDAQFFKPFVDGTTHTLEVSCKTKASPQKPFIKGGMPQPEFEIAGVIGITSPKFTGTITLCFSGKVFLGLMSSMLGEEFGEITKDLEDGAAELLNMIFGHAKVALNNQGHTIQKALPTVIRGKGLSTTHLGKNPVVVLPFETSFGQFHIEISTEE